MANVEQQNTQHPNQELPKGEVVFSKQLTLRELLQIKPRGEGETENLLNDVPFDFEVRDLGKSLLHIVSFSESQPVSFEQLVPLLKAAKPGGTSRRKRQNIEGILADWRIILPAVREKEPESKRLYDYHKNHIPEFSEFEANHFKLFWNVLNSWRRRENEAQIFDKQLSQFIDEGEFFAKYGKQHDIFSDPMEIKNIVSADLELLKSFLEKKGFRIPPNLRMLHLFPGTEDLDTFKFFNSISEEEQRILGIEFYKESVNEEGIGAERYFGSVRRWSHEGSRGQTTTLIGEGDELNRIGPKGVLYPLDVAIREGHSSAFDKTVGKPDGFKRLDNGQIELTRGEAFARISFVKGKDGYKKAKMEYIQFSTVKTMIPLIVWQTNKQTGERSYYCGRFNQLPRHDTLLGKLIVAAYSPEVRDQMPKEIKMKGINGEEKIQPMLEASSVLLVPRHSKLFLTQSPVISGLEALAKH